MSVLAKVRKAGILPIMPKAASLPGAANENLILSAICGFPTVPAKELKVHSSLVFQKARVEPVAITYYDRPAFVLISAEQFAAMHQSRQSSFDRVNTEFDALCARLNTLAASKAQDSFFNSVLPPDQNLEGA